MKALFLLAASLLTFSYSNATAWNVGPSRAYTAPSQVKSLVQDGDTVFMDGGIYANDATKWSKANLKFIGLGTGANRTTLQYTGDIPNGKGIFVFETPGASDNPYLANIVFDGAQVSDVNGANGAGIRFQANNITVNNCKFMKCQNGILEGHPSVTTSNVIIENCEFENNGYQLQNDPNYSGYEHNIYISASADTLLVQNCYFHHPRGQANSLKTRAQRSFILYNLIDEESTGYGSWEINIAQGGLNIIMGNIIIQGTSGANHGIIGYDAVTNPLEDFYFVNNTVINKYAGNIKYFNIVPPSGINTFKIFNNIFASVAGGGNTMFTGNVPAALDTSNNLNATNYLTVGFANPSANDYSLLSTATAAIDAGTDAGNTNTSFALTPAFTYQSFTSALSPRAITGAAIDIGAYEYLAPLAIAFTNLSASAVGKSVVCLWQTQHEVNGSHFIVERSVDATHYTVAGVVEGSSIMPGKYSFTDVNAFSSAAGKLFYRIKMGGNNGGFIYSNVAMVNVEKEAWLNVYPNPAGAQLRVTYSSPCREKAVLTLVNRAGKTVYCMDVLLEQGNNYFALNTLFLMAGEYIVWLKGTTAHSTPIIKLRD